MMIVTILVTGGCNDMEKSFTPKEVTDQLELTAETLKKYSLLLEKNGMEITRNNRGHRQYSDENIKVLKALIHLNKEKSVSLEDAASMVCSTDFDFTVMENNGKNPTVTTLWNDVMTVQNEVVVTVMEQLHLLHNELELRDKKDNAFKQVVTDRLEEQRELIIKQEAALERLSQQLEIENKKSIWQKLFGKK